MRIHRTKKLAQQWNYLPVEVRNFIQGLRRNPTPTTARAIPEEPGAYEDFIAGHWIGWTVDETGGETVIVIDLAE